MASSDIDALLTSIEEMRQEFGRYLAGDATPREAIRTILAKCEHMRTKKLDDAMNYWLGAIERHAVDICGMRADSTEGMWQSSSREFSPVHLLEDITLLRLQVVSARSASH